MNYEAQLELWEQAKRFILTVLNNLTKYNIIDSTKSILECNIIRYRGLFSNLVIKCQNFAPSFSKEYATLIALFNTRIPSIGNIVVNRLILSIINNVVSNNKIARSSAKFIAALLSQQMIKSDVIFNLIRILFDYGENGLEVIIDLLLESGSFLIINNNRKSLQNVCDMLMSIALDGRVKCTSRIKVLIDENSTDFQRHPYISEELDIIDETEKIKSFCSIQFPLNVETLKKQSRYDLDSFIFRPPEVYAKEDSLYLEIKNELLSSQKIDDTKRSRIRKVKIVDENTNNNNTTDNNTLLRQRRDIYLGIVTSFGENVAANKFREAMKRGVAMKEILGFLIDCCREMRSNVEFNASTAAILCDTQTGCAAMLEELFAETYSNSEGLNSRKGENVARFYARLLASQKISWNILSCVRLTVRTTDARQRVFLKHLFVGVAELKGVPWLTQEFGRRQYSGLFHRTILPLTPIGDLAEALEFFGNIGLGECVESEREYYEKRRDTTG